ncbi:MAG: hypothetical protein NT039_03410 [Candidatus Berkelbacteria bacterium]|nr:hypothetical protein [Candidatus Berkelbacteria bacterium]
MGNNLLSKIVFSLSIIAVIIAIIDSTRTIGVWLSATSWLVIAGVLGIWAIFLKPCDCKCCKDEK